MMKSITVWNKERLAEIMYFKRWRADDDGDEEEGVGRRRKKCGLINKNSNFSHDTFYSLFNVYASNKCKDEDE